MRPALLVLAAALTLLPLAACAECGADEGRCDGTVSQVCKDEEWSDVVDCSEQSLACVEDCVAGQPCCR